MLRSFVKLSLRNLFRKNKLFTLVNIVGLAVGLSSVWLAALFIYDEYTFDTSFSDAERVHRITLDFTSDGNVTSWAKTSAPIGQYLHGMFPEIEQITRIRKNPGTDLLAIDEKQFYEPQLFFADSTFFQIFDIPFVRGNQARALDDIHSIVLTEKLAMKFYGTTEVVGKTLRYDNRLDFKITGVMESVPANTHFRPEAIATFSSLTELLGDTRLAHWGQFDHYTYVKVAKGTFVEQLESKLPQLLKRHAPEWVQEKETLFLQPVTSIHLISNRKDEISANSSERYAYILGTIALFILLMACANFINLSTATQLGRTKELAIQKALGANSGTLFLYFFVECIIILATALLISVVFTHLIIPAFNASTGKQVSLLTSTWLLAPAAGLVAFIAFLTGMFPAMQSRKLIVTQISKPSKGTGKSTLRSGLVIFQFTTSIFLIICTWVVFTQLRFLENGRFGFSSDHVIVIPVKDRSQNDRFKTLSHEIEQLPGVIKASFSSSTPGANNSLTYTYTMVVSETGEQALATFIVDDSFFDLFGLELIAGRILDPLSTDTLSDVIINEAAVDFFNLAQPIGQRVTGKVKGKVVGVVKNFNHTSLHESVQPVIMYPFKPAFRMVSVKLKSDQIKEGISALQKKWPELYNGYPLEYGFLNEEIRQLYGSELQLSEAYISFSLVALIIAGVGLVGLTTFLLNRKFKEISIRKVFGGSVLQIIGWVYSGYFLIIVSASVLAGIAGYFFMERWLSQFSYQIDLRIIHFLIPPLLMASILFLTTGFQTLKAATADPVKYLREE